MTQPAAGEIARGLAARPFLTTQPAAAEIARLTAPGGVMWEAVELHRLAEWRARAVGDPEIDLGHVQWVCAQQGIDAHGLRELDRRVIRALLAQPRVRGGAVVYGASERDTALLAQVDLAEYRQSVRPRLLARGLLTTRPGVGQALTALALEWYA